MNHDDFASINLEDVLAKTLAFCREGSGASVVHWISDFGLSRVREEHEERFASEDIMAQHVLSLPAQDPLLALKLWDRVAGDFGAHQILPVAYQGHTLGYLYFEAPRTVANLRDGLAIAAKYLAFAYQHLAARSDSYLDELTGLYNQRYLPMALDLEIARARREKQSFTLLFLDIDRFKAVNDGRGHWVGSRLLVELGKVLRKQVRACDYCFRYGGDEFIVLLGNVDATVATTVAERIRRVVEQTVFRVEQEEIQFTVSIGLAAFRNTPKPLRL